MIEAGTLIVNILEKQKVERVFCVPGESYLSVMNGLQDTSIETILCKHEGGASIMAEADGKLTGRPGIIRKHIKAKNKKLLLKKDYKQVYQVIRN